MIMNTLKHIILLVNTIASLLANLSAVTVTFLLHLLRNYMYFVVIEFLVCLLFNYQFESVVCTIK